MERKQMITWVSEDAGIWLESDCDYTLFSIREERDSFYLAIAGENWKKRCKPLKITSLQQGRRILVKFLEKSDMNIQEVTDETMVA